MFKRSMTFMLSIVLCGLLLTGCGGGSQAPAANKGDIKLGVIAPLSGAGTSYGIGIKQGAEMAVDEINAAGGINGRKIKMITVDDATNPAESVTAIKRLIEHENVDVIVGGWGSSQVLAGQPVVEKAGVPYIIVGATNPKLTTEKNHWTFAVIKSDAIQAEEIANSAVKKLNFKKIAIIYDTNDYGTGNKDVFVASLKGMGVTPVTIESFKSDDKDFAAQLSKIKQFEPDAVAVFGTIPAAPAIMIQARNLGINAQFIGTGGLANEQLIALGGKAAEGTILTTYFHEDTNATSQEWSKKIMAKFAGANPAANPILSAWEYRSIKQILAPAIAKAGTDKEALRAAIKGFKGVVIGFDEEVYFNGKNQLVQPTVLIQVKDGKFKLFK